LIHPAKSLFFIILFAILGSWAVDRQIKPQDVMPIITGIIIAAVLMAGFRILAWYLGRFVITNKRLMSTEGVLYRRVAMIPLLRVTDLRYVQSPIGRLLNYGTFKLESASRRNRLRTIADLPNPNELYLRLVEEMYEPAAVEARMAPEGEEAVEDDGELSPGLSLATRGSACGRHGSAPLLGRWDLSKVPSASREGHFRGEAYLLAGHGFPDLELAALLPGTALR
jgi:membrane protein YdbS with pleckstrin-like domain